MAETFEEQVIRATSAIDSLDVEFEVRSISDAVRANPAPVLALLSDDALRAACRERGIGLAEDASDDEYEQVGFGWLSSWGQWLFDPERRSPFHRPVYVRRAGEGGEGERG